MSPEQGETVDVALHEAVFSMMEGLIPEFAGYGVVRERSGNEIPGVAPSNTYPCLDGEWVVIGGNADNLFQRLMIGIGRPDLAADERLPGQPRACPAQRLLDDAISEFTSARSLRRGDGRDGGG